MNLSALAVFGCVFWFTAAAFAQVAPAAPGRMWCRGAERTPYFSTFANCSTNEVCGRTSQGQPYCRGPITGDPGKSLGYKTCPGSEGRTMECQTNLVCAITTAGIPYCTGRGDSFICRGENGASNVTVQCVSGEACEHVLNVGTPYCGGRAEDTSNEERSNSRRIIENMSRTRREFLQKLPLLITRQNFSYMTFPRYLDGEHDVKHTSYSKLSYAEPTSDPCYNRGCSSHGAAFVAVPWNANITGVRYYTSAGWPSDAEGWGTKEAAEKLYPFNIENGQLFRPLNVAQVDKEVGFFLMEKHIVELVPEFDFAVVYANFYNRSHDKVRAAFLVVDWTSR